MNIIYIIMVLISTISLSYSHFETKINTECFCPVETYAIVDTNIYMSGDVGRNNKSLYIIGNSYELQKTDSLMKVIFEINSNFDNFGYYSEHNDSINLPRIDFSLLPKKLGTLIKKSETIAIHKFICSDCNDERKKSLLLVKVCLFDWVKP